MTDNNNSEFAVLFVDDEEKARKMFIRLVSPHFTVFTACDVKDAMQVLEKEASHIGVLITDQRMPGLLGVDLLRHIRKEYPQIIRLLTTAYSDLADAIEAVNTGEIFRYINKPWDVDNLLIDLKLAMSFFTLQHDRSDLIQEKLSVSQHQSMTNSLKNLIALASGKTQYRQPLRAVESFLQQLADPVDCIDTSSIMNQEDYWANEIQTTENMIEANRALDHFLDNNNNLLINDETSGSQTSWQESIDTLNLDDVGTFELETDINQPYFSQTGLNRLLSAITRVMTPGELDISVSDNFSDKVADDKNTIQITVQTSTPNSWLSEQFMKSTEPGSNQKIAELLGAFILVYHVGGTIRLNFDQSQLVGITIHLPKSSDYTAIKDIEGSLWMEDLFVLYS